MIYKAFYHSEIGIIEILGTEDGIISLDFTENSKGEAVDTPDLLKECISELDEYFKGQRRVFTVKLDIQGTEFQKKVWRELLSIPYGASKTYREIAVSIGNPRAVRAVGNANHCNKIALLIPCHRVIGSNGDLTGYAGGLWRKEWLLKLERTGFTEFKN
jgi:methylated-DNA-[protein]-cysteine S-methyltransferase